MSQSHEMKPIRAIVLSVAGGLVVLANGVYGVYIPKLAVFDPTVLASIRLVSGAMILFGGLALWAAPRRHVVCGVIVILFSVPSLLIGGGMLGVLFPIGFMLSLIGGILAIQWRPTPMVTSAIVP